MGWKMGRAALQESFAETLFGTHCNPAFAPPRFSRGLPKVAGKCSVFDVFSPLRHKKQALRGLQHL